LSGTNIDYPPILDGFVLSASMLYLSTNFRASALAQMEVLRRARGYRARHYSYPMLMTLRTPLALHSD